VRRELADILDGMTPAEKQQLLDDLLMLADFILQEEFFSRLPPGPAPPPILPPDFSQN
jgi:hypothetical protein